MSLLLEPYSMNMSEGSARLLRRYMFLPGKESVGWVGLVSVCLALAACATKTCFGFQACASNPFPQEYRWNISSTIAHIPMQGLPAVPRLIARDQPVNLINFGDEAERAKAREAAMSAGGAGGAVQGAMVGLVTLGPLCVVFPPLCIPVVAVGAAAGADKFDVAIVSAEEAGKFRATFEKHATSTALSEFATRELPKPGERDYPRLVIGVTEVVLVPTRNGVTFGLVAEAQGFPGPDQVWKPSKHLVPFPNRSVAGWLASDGRVLESDLQSALRALSAEILRSYLPYEERR